MVNFLPVRIGQSEKTHNPLSLGCWVFGEGDGSQDSEYLSVMEKAVEAGITHFDTAASYGDGKSERLIGSFMKGKRDSLFIASKFRALPEKTAFLGQIEKSLKNFRTDYIDLYYIHWPMKGIDPRYSMEALAEAKERGMIRAAGVSNFTVGDMQATMDICPVDANQFCHNLIWRRDEQDTIPFCRENDISVVTYSSIAQGILTGKFALNHGIDKADIRSGTVYFRPEVWPHVHEGIERLKQISASTGHSLLHLAILWVLSREGITSVLVGSRNAKQLEENIAVMSVKVDDKILEQMTAVSNRVLEHIPDTGNIFQYYP